MSDEVTKELQSERLAHEETKKRLEELEDALSNDVGSSDPYWYKLSNVDNKIIIAAIENSRARRGNERRNKKDIRRMV